MRTLILARNPIVALLAPIALAFVLSGCSDEPAPRTTQVPTAEKPHFDHAHGAEVTDLVKHRFEHQFAEQCIARETRNSANKELDRKRFEEPCLCIATFMMKDLTAQEAKKFLEENKQPHSLTIRFDNAAYHCLQAKAQADLYPGAGKR